MTRVSPTIVVQPVEDGEGGARAYVVILDEATGEEVVVPLAHAHRLADAVHHVALELQGIRVRPRHWAEGPMPTHDD